MAFTNYSSFIKELIPGSNSVANSAGKAQQVKLGNSPVEAIDPEDNIASDPLKFNFVQYPIDLANYETGHYMIFNILQNEFAASNDLDFQAAQRVGINASEEYSATVFKNGNLKDSRGNDLPPTSLENSVLSLVPKTIHTVGGVAIYMPAGVKVSYGMDYNIEATNLFGALTRGGSDAIDSFKAGNYKDTLDTALDTFQRGGLNYVADLVGELSATLGAGDPVKLASKAVGIAINPHEEQFFNKPNFRTFNYNFQFYPRSKEEVKKVQDIIFMFKYHAHPNISSEDKIGSYFQVPSEFEIQYAYFDKQNQHLNKIAKCVLQTVNVSYGPEEQFSTFEDDGVDGPSPVSYGLDLTFLEQQYLTKQQILKGY